MKKESAVEVIEDLIMVYNYRTYDSLPLALKKEVVGALLDNESIEEEGSFLVETDMLPELIYTAAKALKHGNHSFKDFLGDIIIDSALEFYADMARSLYGRVYLEFIGDDE